MNLRDAERRVEEARRRCEDADSDLKVFGVLCLAVPVFLVLIAFVKAWVPS